MTLQKAIFDMDGTILDSTAMWASSAAHVVTALGYTPKDTIERDTLPLGMLEYAPFLKQDYQLPHSLEEINRVLEQRHDNTHLPTLLSLFPRQRGRVPASLPGPLVRRRCL